MVPAPPLHLARELLGSPAFRDRIAAAAPGLIGAPTPDDLRAAIEAHLARVLPDDATAPEVRARTARAVRTFCSAQVHRERFELAIETLRSARVAGAARRGAKALRLATADDLLSGAELRVLRAFHRGGLPESPAAFAVHCLNCETIEQFRRERSARARLAGSLDDPDFNGAGLAAVQPAATGSEVRERLRRVAELLRAAGASQAEVQRLFAMTWAESDAARAAAVLGGDVTPGALNQSLTSLRGRVRTHRAALATAGEPDPWAVEFGR